MKARGQVSSSYVTRRPSRVGVACFGEILWDLFEDSRDSSRLRRAVGGASANLAIALARLGVRSSVVGAVGRDRLGDAAVAQIEKERVDVRSIVRLPNRTGLTFIARDRHGEPSFVGYREQTADIALRPAHLTPSMVRAEWVVVGTSAPMAATLALLRHAEDAGASVLVDLNVRPHLFRDRAAMERAVSRLVRRAHLVKASMPDVAAIAGRDGTDWLRSTAAGRTWILTRGAGTATVVGLHGEVGVPARRVRCVDATGGGDAFLAGLLAALLAAEAKPGTVAWGDAALWSRALEVGHAMGAKAVSRVGTVSGLARLGGVRTAVQAFRPGVTPPYGRAKPR